LELLDSKENLIQLLTPEKGGSKLDGWIDKDTTAQSYLVSFPSDLSCKGCTVRPKLYTIPSRDTIGLGISMYLILIGF
jgi:hypothetical protein